MTEYEAIRRHHVGMHASQPCYVEGFQCDVQTLLDGKTLEEAFFLTEGEWARKGSGMTVEQSIGARMVFEWLRGR